MIDHLLERLPALARCLADKSWMDIDDPAEHDTDWHQWGILETHVGSDDRSSPCPMPRLGSAFRFGATE